jgi:ATP-dependent Clp protease protease subunit
MIHQPSGGFQGQASDIQIQAREIQKMKAKLNSILAENTGKSIDIVERDSDRDYFMSSQESFEYGLIDKVLDRSK